MYRLKVSDKIAAKLFKAGNRGIKSLINVKGEALIRILDALSLKVLKEYKIRNVITDGGLQLFAEAMANPFVTSAGGTCPTRYYWYLVLGTGSGTPSSSDTSLFNPISASAKHGSISQSGNQYQYYVRYMPEEANGYTYTEAGIYDKVPYSGSTPEDYSSGVLLNHLMLSPTLTKDSSILVDFTITITFS